MHVNAPSPPTHTHPAPSQAGDFEGAIATYTRALSAARSTLTAERKEGGASSIMGQLGNMLVRSASTLWVEADAAATGSEEGGGPEAATAELESLRRRIAVSVSLRGSPRPAPRKGAGSGSLRRGRKASEASLRPVDFIEEHTLHSAHGVRIDGLLARCRACVGRSAHSARSARGLQTHSARSA